MIVVPYVDGYLHKLTAQTPGAEFVRIPKDDPYAYWRLIRELYEQGFTFTIVEHDIIITQEQLQSLDDCPEPWCIFGYLRNGGEMQALGTLRLRLEIHQKYPWLLRRETPDKVDWLQCDGTLYGRLMAAGYSYHRHYPNVGHEPSAKRVLDGWEVS